MSPLGVVVLEGEDKGLPEARRLPGKLWDGRSDISAGLVVWKLKGERTEA